MLYIVATPIGNLEDITLRALRIFKSVDYILCEDTRVTKKLLDHYEIYPIKSLVKDQSAKQFDRLNKKLISYHQHSSDKKIQEILELIKNNNVALVTDAGTPGISDPGNKLIARLVETRHCLVSSNTNIVPVPGPSALITALSISGLPTDKFIFKGFVPHKKGRETFLRQVLDSEETVVFYESCHRILKTLSALCYPSFCHSRESGNPEKDNWIPDQVRDDKKEKHLVVCRELTKKFETIYRGTANEILEQIKKDFPTGNPKGEFVVISG
ncbi:MAG TPA: 16S rRNA (cytidine(1402)-2'-O)-methyltransferase [bacterium]|nr:16S rRNA (cytidine(1402)-2'-O)-methyltransferase [bacterium]